MAATNDRGKDPNDLIVTKNRANYLAKLTNISVKKISGKKVAEVNELIKWKVDPQFLLFRRICGKVIKKAPDGTFQPVPGATVHLEDTDCSFFGFFPAEPPFFWLFPIKCHREVIATVTTDACGRFCAFLPFWDIDRLLRFRRTRVCFLDFYRPRLRDFLEAIPKPDPAGPIIKQCSCPEAHAKVRSIFGADLAERMTILAKHPESRRNAEELSEMLEVPMLQSPPPMASLKDKRLGDPMARVAEKNGIDEKLLRQVDFSRFVGPFIGCRDIWHVEWVPFLDIPDITFRVTQDIDGDGVEELIYNESFFDVRWNADPSLFVTLIANANALSVPVCEPIEELPCRDFPDISTAGYMTLLASHHDNTSGYGCRVNRPVPAPGNYPPPPAIGGGGANAVSPYAGGINLHGCQRLDKATHYRLTYILNGTGAVQPFTGIEWYAPRSAASPGPPIHIKANDEGWYPLVDAALLEHPSWLLHWNTGRYANGTYEVRLEVGREDHRGGPTLLSTSAAKKFTIDNSLPEDGFIEIRWRYAAIAGSWTDGNSTVLPAVCPVIERNTALGPLRVRVVWRATAGHLRNAEISFTGCGGGNPSLVQPTAAAPQIEEYRHWHIDKDDNTVLQTNEFEISPTSEPGCYDLRLYAVSRAFNPSGFDYGPSEDWYINQAWLWRYAHRSISVVNI